MLCVRGGPGDARNPRASRSEPSQLVPRRTSVHAEPSQLVPHLTATLGKKPHDAHAVRSCPVPSYLVSR
jgi:hypothetical protein